MQIGHEEEVLVAEPLEETTPADPAPEPEPEPLPAEPERVKEPVGA